MEIKLQEKLYEKYPDLFFQKDLNLQQTGMCWGLECGDGWYDLIDKTCQLLSALDNPPQFGQVKEKYGTLRLYLDGATDEAYEITRVAERASCEICELCGEAGRLHDIDWCMVRCKSCERE